MSRQRDALVPVADEILFTDPADLALPVRVGRRGNPDGSKPRAKSKPAARWKLDESSLRPYAEAEKFLTRTALVRATGWSERLPKPVTSSRDAARICEHLKHSDVEIVAVLALNAKQQLMAIHEVAIGDQLGVAVTVQHVLKVPLLCGGSSVVLIHNHPSGDSFPSPQDIEFTQQCKAGLKCVGLALLDHVIVALNGDYSFLDKGLLFHE